MAWEPPAQLRGAHRAISEVVGSCTPDMRWNKIEAFAELSPTDATLASICWPSVLNKVWASAGGDDILPDVSQAAITSCLRHWNLEVWQRILHTHGIASVQGLQNYIEVWATQDSNVEAWIRGKHAVMGPTADIGGWLADYCYTQFLVLSGQARPTIKYRVVCNDLYKSLFCLLGGSELNPVRSGDILELLCWHAFEHNRGELILAIVWHSVNRGLPLPTETSSSSSAGPQASCSNRSGDAHANASGASYYIKPAVPTIDNRTKQPKQPPPIAAPDALCIKSGADSGAEAISMQEQSGIAKEIAERPVPGAPKKTNTNTNVKKDILKPLLALCVYDAVHMQWDVDNTEHELDISILNWRQTLGENFPEGEKVVKCMGKFFTEEPESNQAGKPRLDIVWPFSNGIWVRYHPGAAPIWSTDDLPTDAMKKRMQYGEKLRARARR